MEQNKKNNENKNLEKKAAEKKKETPKEPPKKVYYDVTVEVLSPITVKYKVWAYTPEEAAKEVEKGRVKPVYMTKPILRDNTIRTISVYLAGTIMKLFSLKKFHNIR